MTSRKTPLWQRVLPWLITAVCFSYLYHRISAQAAREGQTALEFLLAVFGGVSWWRWLALMIPYSAFFFLIDSLVVWRVVNWFNAPVRYVDILPIRGSTYILSILNAMDRWYDKTGRLDRPEIVNDIYRFVRAALS